MFNGGNDGDDGYLWGGNDTSLESKENVLR